MVAPTVRRSQSRQSRAVLASLRLAPSDPAAPGAVEVSSRAASPAAPPAPATTRSSEHEPSPAGSKGTEDLGESGGALAAGPSTQAASVGSHSAEDELWFIEPEDAALDKLVKSYRRGTKPRAPRALEAPVRKLVDLAAAEVRRLFRYRIKREVCSSQGYSPEVEENADRAVEVALQNFGEKLEDFVSLAEDRTVEAWSRPGFDGAPRSMLELQLRRTIEHCCELEAQVEQGERRNDELRKQFRVLRRQYYLEVQQWKQRCSCLQMKVVNCFPGTMDLELYNDDITFFDIQESMDPEVREIIKIRMKELTQRHETDLQLLHRTIEKLRTDLEFSERIKREVEEDNGFLKDRLKNLHVEKATTTMRFAAAKTQLNNQLGVWGLDTPRGSRVLPDPRNRRRRETTGATVPSPSLSPSPSPSPSPLGQSTKTGLDVRVDDGLSKLQGLKELQEQFTRQLEDMTKNRGSTPEANSLAEDMLEQFSKRLDSVRTTLEPVRSQAAVSRVELYKSQEGELSQVRELSEKLKNQVSVLHVEKQQLARKLQQERDAPAKLRQESKQLHADVSRRDTSIKWLEEKAKRLEGEQEAFKRERDSALEHVVALKQQLAAAATAVRRSLRNSSRRGSVVAVSPTAEQSSGEEATPGRLSEMKQQTTNMESATDNLNVRARDRKQPKPRKGEDKGGESGESRRQSLWDALSALGVDLPDDASPGLDDDNRPPTSVDTSAPGVIPAVTPPVIPTPPDTTTEAPLILEDDFQVLLEGDRPLSASSSVSNGSSSRSSERWSRSESKGTTAEGPRTDGPRRSKVWPWPAPERRKTQTLFKQGNTSISKVLHQHLLNAAVQRERNRWQSLVPRCHSEKVLRTCSKSLAETTPAAALNAQSLEDVLTKAEEEMEHTRYLALWESVGGTRLSKTSVAPDLPESLERSHLAVLRLADSLRSWHREFAARQSSTLLSADAGSLRTQELCRRYEAAEVKGKIAWELQRQCLTRCQRLLEASPEAAHGFEIDPALLAPSPTQALQMLEPELERIGTNPILQRIHAVRERTRRRARHQLREVVKAAACEAGALVPLQEQLDESAVESSLRAGLRISSDAKLADAAHEDSTTTAKHGPSLSSQPLEELTSRLVRLRDSRLQWYRAARASAKGLEEDQGKAEQALCRLEALAREDDESTASGTCWSSESDEDMRSMGSFDADSQQHEVGRLLAAVPEAEGEISSPKGTAARQKPKLLRSKAKTLEVESEKALRSNPMPVKPQRQVPKRVAPRRKISRVATNARDLVDQSERGSNETEEAEPPAPSLRLLAWSPPPLLRKVEEEAVEQQTAFATNVARRFSKNLEEEVEQAVEECDSPPEGESRAETRRRSVEAASHRRKSLYSLLDALRTGGPAAAKEMLRTTHATAREDLQSASGLFLEAMKAEEQVFEEKTPQAAGFEGLYPEAESSPSDARSRGLLVDNFVQTAVENPTLKVQGTQTDFIEFGRDESTRRLQFRKTPNTFEGLRRARMSLPGPTLGIGLAQLPQRLSKLNDIAERDLPEHRRGRKARSTGVSSDGSSLTGRLSSELRSMPEESWDENMASRRRMALTEGLSEEERNDLSRFVCSPTNSLGASVGSSSLDVGLRATPPPAMVQPDLESHNEAESEATLEDDLEDSGRSGRRRGSQKMVRTSFDTEVQEIEDTPVFTSEGNETLAAPLREEAESSSGLGSSSTSSSSSGLEDDDTPMSDFAVEVVNVFQQTDLWWDEIPGKVLSWLRLNLMQRQQALMYSSSWVTSELDDFPRVTLVERERLLKDFEFFLFNIMGASRPARGLEQRRLLRHQYREMSQSDSLDGSAKSRGTGTPELAVQRAVNLMQRGRLLRCSRQSTMEGAGSEPMEEPTSRPATCIPKQLSYAADSDSDIADDVRAASRSTVRSPRGGSKDTAIDRVSNMLGFDVEKAKLQSVQQDVYCLGYAAEKLDGESPVLAPAPPTDLPLSINACGLLAPPPRKSASPQRLDSKSASPPILDLVSALRGADQADQQQQQQQQLPRLSTRRVESGPLPFDRLETSLPNTGAAARISRAGRAAPGGASVRKETPREQREEAARRAQLLVKRLEALRPYHGGPIPLRIQSLLKHLDDLQGQGLEVERGMQWGAGRVLRRSSSDPLHACSEPLDDIGEGLQSGGEPLHGQRESSPSKTRERANARSIAALDQPRQHEVLRYAIERLRRLGAPSPAVGQPGHKRTASPGRRRHSPRRKFVSPHEEPKLPEPPQELRSTRMVVPPPRSEEAPAPKDLQREAASSPTSPPQGFVGAVAWSYLQPQTPRFNGRAGSKSEARPGPPSPQPEWEPPPETPVDLEQRWSLGAGAARAGWHRTSSSAETERRASPEAPETPAADTPTVSVFAKALARSGGRPLTRR